MVCAAACAGSTNADAPDASPLVERTSTSVADAEPSSTTSSPETVVADDDIDPDPPPEILISVGDEELVFDSSAFDCGSDAIPDLPARAFRTDAAVSLVLSSEINHRLVGASFDGLVLDCDPILSSAYDNDPAAHTHHEWLAATWALDERTVLGIVHNEFRGFAAELADSRRVHLSGRDVEAWTFLRRSGAADTPMTPATSGWSGGGLCAVDFWGSHPDVGCDTVSRWTSDLEGTVVVDLDARLSGSGGDGVTVDLMVDGESRWRQTLTDGAAADTVRLEIDLVIGTIIEVVVGANGGSSFDGTEWRLVITGDGERCGPDPWACTHVELTATRSDDGGASFAAPATPPPLVATPPGVYAHDAGLTARWQPTNIVEHPEGGHVMLIQLDEHRAGAADQYSCLLRTDDIKDPGAWRAWDGSAFSLAAIDPYRSDATQPSCARVAPAPISGLVWAPDLDAFIAVGGFTQFGENGHYAMTSRDLLTWSKPVFIRPAEFVYSASAPPFDPYPTLIDHTSASINFDVTGPTPHLYFTRINDSSSLDFDLFRVPLEITAVD